MGLFSRIVARLGGRGRGDAGNVSRSVLALDPFGFAGDSDGRCNATYMSCIDFYARILSKMTPKIALKGELCTDMPNISAMLALRPNPLQNAVNLWKQFASSYFREGVGILWIDRDLTESSVDRQVRGLWVIDPSESAFAVGVREGSASGESLFSFNLSGRRIVCYREDLCIMVRSPTVENPFVSHSRVLQGALNVIDRNLTGIEKTIANANVIRFIATSGRVMDKQDIMRRQDAINEQLSRVNANGVFFVDGASTIQQVSSSPGWNATAAVEPFIGQIYEYFGLSRELVSNMATDDQYNSFVETAVEPFAKELAIELTNQLFPRKAVATGRRVLIDTNQLFTASQSHRLSAGTLLINSGVYYPNEIRKAIGFDPLPEEDNVKIERIDRVQDTGKEEGNDDEGNPEGTDVG